MSSIQRLTLIRDPTDKFPKKANNSFKIRLSERLSLPGDQWYATLMSLTVPDQGQSNGVIATDPHTIVIQFTMTFLTTGQFQEQGVPREIGRDYECQTTCHVGQPVLKTSDARSAQQKHAATHVRTKVRLDA